MTRAARRSARVLALLLALLSGASFAKCPAPVNQQTSVSFLQTPDDLLTFFPLGGAPLLNATRSYVTASAMLRNTLLSLAGRASARQREAIAGAFAEAYAECRFERPDLGREIDRAARAAADKPFRRAYVSALSDGGTPPLDGVEDDAPRKRLDLAPFGVPGVRYAEKPLPLPGGSWLHN